MLMNHRRPIRLGYCVRTYMHTLPEGMLYYGRMVLRMYSTTYTTVGSEQNVILLVSTYLARCKPRPSGRCRGAIAFESRPSR